MTIDQECALLDDMLSVEMLQAVSAPKQCPVTNRHKEGWISSARFLHHLTMIVRGTRDD